MYVICCVKMRIHAVFRRRIACLSRQYGVAWYWRGVCALPIYVYMVMSALCHNVLYLCQNYNESLCVCDHVTKYHQFAKSRLNAISSNCILALIWILNMLFSIIQRTPSVAVSISARMCLHNFEVWFRGVVLSVI